MSQIAIVTGAASGIGACLVQRLLARGYKVCACDINEVSLQRLNVPTHQQQAFMSMTLDVRDASAWQQLVDAVMARWQRIDVLANVAGVLREGWVINSTEADIDFHFDINVKGVILGMQAVLPNMQAAGHGHIVNIASLASLSPVPGIALYSASKFAVRGYSLAAGMELAEKGIAVTTICPDAVQTPMLDIQKGKAETVLTFSGPRALTADEVVDAIVDDALVNKPLEIMLPTWRGATAKAANLVPNLSARAMSFFRKAGLKRQAALSAGKDPTQR